VRTTFIRGSLALVITLSSVALTSALHAQPNNAAQGGAGAGAATPSGAPEAPSTAAQTPLSDALTGEAKADYESAKILFIDGDNGGAVVKFKSAYEKSKDPRLLWNIAACEKNLRHYSKALTLVRRYVQEGASSISEQDKAEAQDLIRVMEPLTAKVRVNVNAPGAEVSIDDEPLGTTPIAPVVLDIGGHKVRVRKAEFEEIVKDVTVSGGAAEMIVELALVPLVHEGRLTVRASPESAISIDGKVMGSGVWSGALPSGGHTLRVTAPKMQAYQSEVYLQDKEQRELPVTLQPEPSKGMPLWVWIVGGGVVAGGLGLGGYALFSGGGNTYEGPSGNLSPGVVQASRSGGLW
jgi:hypothetical protein